MYKEKKREIEEYEIAKSKGKVNKKYTVEERLEWVEDAMLELRASIDDLYEQIDLLEEEISELEGRDKWTAS